MDLTRKECKHCDYKRLVRETGEVLLEGDYYHDKIHDKIEGYLMAFQYLNTQYTLKTEEIVCEYCTEYGDEEEE